jgi:hypothetical protein
MFRGSLLQASTVKIDTICSSETSVEPALDMTPDVRNISQVLDASIFRLEEYFEDEGNGFVPSA